MIKFKKTCRQFVVHEYCGMRLYERYPDMENISDVGAMERLLHAADTKNTEMPKFLEILQSKELDFLPFASTIHDYLRKYDKEWYDNDFEKIQNS